MQDNKGQGDIYKDWNKLKMLHMEENGFELRLKTVHHFDKYQKCHF